MKRFYWFLLAVLLLASCLPLGALADVEQSFADVDPDAWYAWCVEDTEQRGLMNGTGDGLFMPDGDLTRAMLVTVLWRLTGCPVPRETAPFDDVPGGKWYSDAIAWAAESRVVEGYGNGMFGLTDPVTREQMAVIFFRWAKENGLDTAFTPCDSMLREEAEIKTLAWETDGEGQRATAVNAGKAVSDWAADAVQWAAEHDFLVRREVRGLNPYGSGAWYLCAPDAATRAEVAVFLSRFCRTYLDGEETPAATVPFRPDTEDPFLSMELPETWMGAYRAVTVGYEGVPEAFGLAFSDLSNLRPRAVGGALFELTFWPEGVDSGRFGGWEALGDAVLGQSGRLCTVDTSAGKLNLYVTYPTDQYSEDNPKNYLKMQSQVEGILQSIRFDRGVTVLDAAAGYSFGG